MSEVKNDGVNFDEYSYWFRTKMNKMGYGQFNGMSLSDFDVLLTKFDEYVKLSKESHNLIMNDNSDQIIKKLIEFQCPALPNIMAKHAKQLEEAKKAQEINNTKIGDLAWKKNAITSVYPYIPSLTREFITNGRGARKHYEEKLVRIVLTKKRKEEEEFHKKKEHEDLLAFIDKHNVDIDITRINDVNYLIEEIKDFVIEKYEAICPHNIDFGANRDWYRDYRSSVGDDDIYYYVYKDFFVFNSGCFIGDDLNDKCHCYEDTDYAERSD
jgi:hypothetical protein